MTNLIIEVPDDLARSLEGIAAAQDRASSNWLLNGCVRQWKAASNIVWAPQPQCCEPCKNLPI